MLATKEKSHPGFQLPIAALHPGFGFAISNTATGLADPSYNFRGGPRSSGYFRDSETTNDYAINRYYQPGMGRFLTPDPYQQSAGPRDPRSWNRYSYVLGDPVNLVDRKGLDPDCDPDLKSCDDPCDDPESIFCFSTGGGNPPSGGGTPLPPDQAYINEVGTLEADGIFGQTTIAGNGEPQNDAFQVSLDPASYDLLVANGLLQAGSITLPATGGNIIVTVGAAVISAIYYWVTGKASNQPTPEECKKEWEAAIADCTRYLSKPNPPRGITGGYTDIYQCAKGLVSQACGGNRIIYAKSKEEKRSSDQSDGRDTGSSHEASRNTCQSR